MRLFRRGSDEERERREAAEAAQEASEAEIERGGLPLRARERLAELATGGVTCFTSDLSVSEFALAHSAGLRPISQVMGCSVYHVGWRGAQWMKGAWRSGSSQELRNLSAAWNEARTRAFGRLAQEAELAGAHAVVGVELRRGDYDWASDAIEYVAVGTAVRDGSAAGGAPVQLSNVSVQEYRQLQGAGYESLGIVGASSVYYLIPSWQTRKAERGFFASRQNQELVDFTQGVYDARETALEKLNAEARALGAAGVVGVTIDEGTEEYDVDDDRTDFIVTFHVIGTAIAESGAPEGELSPRAAVPLRSAPRPPRREE